MRRVKGALLLVGLGVLATPQAASAHHRELAWQVTSPTQGAPVPSCGYCRLMPGEYDPDCDENSPADTPSATDHYTDHDGNCSQ